MGHMMRDPLMTRPRSPGIARPHPAVPHGCTHCGGALLWEPLEQEYACLLCGRTVAEARTLAHERGLEELIARFAT